MKNYGTIARSLIALFLVVAGYKKLMDFSGTAGYITSLGLPMPEVVAALVIIVEIVVALAFAFGYKLRETGYILIGFILLTIVFVHNDMGQLGVALKNLAIIGGILLAICCKDKHHG